MSNETKVSGPVDVLAADLRRMCGHDSRSVDGCITCEAADRLEECNAAVAELIATQRDTLRMLEAAQRQLGMYSADNPRILRARAALAKVGGAK